MLKGLKSCALVSCTLYIEFEVFVVLSSLFRKYLAFAKKKKKKGLTFASFMPFHLNVKTLIARTETGVKVYPQIPQKLYTVICFRVKVSAR